MDGCPGLVVMGEHSRSEGHVFESHHIISLMLVKIVMFVCKDETKRKRCCGWHIKKHSQPLKFVGTAKCQLASVQSYVWWLCLLLIWVAIF